MFWYFFERISNMSCLEVIQQKILEQFPTLDVEINKTTQQVSILINAIEISELKINVEDNHIVSFDFVATVSPIVNNQDQIDLKALMSLLNKIMATEN